MPYVLALGSSSLAPGAPLPRALSDAWGVEVRAGGIVGYSPRRWASEIREHPADFARLVAGAAAVVVYLPANGAPSSSSVVELDALIRARAGVPVWWMVPPRWPASSEHAERIAAWARAIASAGVATLARAPALRNGDVRADGLHLTSDGAYHVAMHTPSPLRFEVDPNGPERGARRGELLPYVAAGVALALLLWTGER